MDSFAFLKAEMSFSISATRSKTMLPGCRLAPLGAEHSVEFVASSFNGFVACSLPVRLDAMLEAFKLPTGHSRLDGAENPECSEEGVEVIVSSSIGFVAWFVPVRIDTALEA